MPLLVEILRPFYFKISLVDPEVNPLQPHKLYFYIMLVLIRVL